MQGELLQTDGAMHREASQDEGALHSTAAGHDQMPPLMVSDPITFNIVELEVSKMEQHRYYLKIECQKAPRIVVQLTRALEALRPMEIISALLASVSDHVVISVVAKLKEDEEALEAEELKSRILEVTSKFGLYYCRSLS